MFVKKIPSRKVFTRQVGNISHSIDFRSLGDFGSLAMTRRYNKTDLTGFKSLSGLVGI
jgi:hypothetical protein